MDNYMYFITSNLDTILSHESNALFHHVTPQEVFLGKAGSFSQKQVWTCLVKTGND